VDGDQGAFGQHLLLEGFASTDDESGSAERSWEAAPPATAAAEVNPYVATVAAKPDDRVCWNRLSSNSENWMSMAYILAAMILFRHASAAASVVSLRQAVI
jgi:hypothetical protein